MYKNIFLTGATGFVGSFILEKLTAYGFNVKALIRNKNKIKRHYENCEYIVGDILDINTYIDSLEGIDVIINLVGIIREYKSKGVTFNNMHVKATKNLLTLAEKFGIKRFIQMSANGAAADSHIKYYLSKYKAEELVKNSNTAYTIFRPSIIFGKGDGFITMLAKNIKTLPFFINFGKGNLPFQLISVNDVATYFADSINNKQTFNETFCLCGEKIYTFSEILVMIQQAMQLKRIFIPIPIILIKGITLLLDTVSFFPFPLTYDQLEMLLKGNICCDNSIDKVFHMKKISLEDQIIDIVKEV